MTAQHVAEPVRDDDDSVLHALSVVKRRWVLVAAAALACLAGAIGYRALAEDTYEASTSVVFGAPTLSDTALQVDRNTNDPERDAATNVLVARSLEVAEAVRRQLGLELSAGSLINSIAVEAEENANVLRITATSVDPTTAARLANAFAGQYIAFKARSEVQGIKAAEDDLRRQLAALAADAPERQSLDQSLQRLSALRAVATGDARVIGPASPPSEPATMGLVPLAVIALIIGTAVGLTVVFLLESVDRRLNSIEALEREYRLGALTGVPQGAFKHAKAEDRVDDLEPYRILRSALAYTSITREVHVVMVTSAVPGEGKTTVAVDLARATALTGRRTVLVELDLRRPTFSQHFDLDARQGVTTALMNRQSVGELLQEPLPGLTNLLVLPSGSLPPHPSELLGSGALVDMLEELAAEDTMVIVDAPPLIPVADAQVLLNHTVIDGALIVARVGVTTRDEARRARSILDRHLLQPLGLVITGLPDAERYGYAAYPSQEPLDIEVAALPPRAASRRLRR